MIDQHVFVSGRGTTYQSKDDRSEEKPVTSWPMLRCGPTMSNLAPTQYKRYPVGPVGGRGGRR